MRSRTPEEVALILRQYSSKVELVKNDEALYRAARRLGEDFFVKNTSHMVRPPAHNKKWTVESAMADARSYSDVTEWREKGRSSYKFLFRCGKLKECADTMKRSRHRAGYWTKETVLNDAKRFSNRKAWERGSPSAYDAAKHNGWYEEACAHMPYISHRNKWKDLGKVEEDAKKYASKSEWQSESYQAYFTALKSGRMDDFVGHMDSGYQNWTEDKILSAVAGCNNISEFIIKYHGAYEAAVRLKLVDKIKSILPPSIAQSSVAERELLASVQKHFPKAQKIRFGKNQKGTSGQRFELDIYVPELRKGVEFNGTYWHGAGFKRKWTSDPEEYHSIKRKFFASRGIDYIEIDEKLWNDDRSACIESVARFLGLPNL